MHLSCELDTFMVAILTAGSLEVFPHYRSTLYETGLPMGNNTLQKDREKNAQDPRQELKNYLDSSLEDTSDQIKWWGVSYLFIRCYWLLT